MNTISLKTFAASIVAVLLISACTKDVLVPPGANGTNGTNGNANVKSQTDTAATWVSNGTTGWFIKFANKSLDSAIQSKGTVQVFMSYDAGTTWNALPLTKYTSVTNNYAMGFTTKMDTVSINWTNTSISLTGLTGGGGAGPGSSPNTIYGANCIFKTICIAASARNANSHLNLNNYAEVKAAYNLK